MYALQTIALLLAVPPAVWAIIDLIGRYRR
ncbi:membrane protein [Mycobacterium phage Skinny]|uniref:Uncharacterized protein n=4 Tax=Bongovirus bongo TaxID=1983750 RepID=A0A0M4S3C9_9CAUD|nr:hypothetical protein PEGLEG_142 [Mycobacterium phage PegLeg]ALF00647.1 hypothetical protein SEA_BRICOLE_141 [Mycobacterium phage Bricole]AXQ52759.1 hypothetical protein SEA_IPHANE7_137 [Mycobacterium phage IPhane7]QDH93695.1 hypothetical protein SEA_LILHOMIEP_139 [Mycobacterium phage LilhomieP]QUU29323.1 hypothetical protein [Mycobacterium phage SirSheldon]UXE05349.1 membrane protein [Mycobacterium phage Skinny]WNM75356.1 hypothetical protein SEA_AUSPICE_140 [Mycobacterium phage Auspice]W